MQRHINNNQFIVTFKISNETTYDFTSIQSLNFWKFLVVVENFAIDLKKFFVVEIRKFFTNAFFFVVDRVKIEIVNFIVFAQMNAKYYYDRKHQFMFMKIDDYAYIRLHHDYDISFTTILNKKLNQQYVNFFKILKKIKRLTYRLNLLFHWRIHFILSITQLKSTTSLNENFFRRFRLNQSKFVYVNDDIVRVKSWKINRLLNKRQIKRRDSKYFVRWREYDSKYDEWRNLSKLKNVAKLMQKYEDVVKIVIFFIWTFIVAIFNKRHCLKTFNKRRRYEKIFRCKIFCKTCYDVHCSKIFNKRRRYEKIFRCNYVKYVIDFVEKIF